MSSKLRILYVLIQGKGGIPHYTAELANAVSAEADVHVMKPVTSTADGLFSQEVTLHDTFESMDISIPDIVKNEVNPLKLFSGMYSYRKMTRIHDIDPDIVHFTLDTESFPHVKLLTKCLRLDHQYPTIETFHSMYPRILLRRGDYFETDEPLKNVLLYNAISLSNKAIPDLTRAHAIVHSKEHKQLLLERSVPREEISVIPHGMSRIFQDFTEDAQVEDELILYFGNITTDKGSDVAIEAVPEIAKRIPDIKLLVAGDGKLTAESERIIEQYPDHFEIRNEFIPNEDVGSLFSRAALVVIPHRRLGGHSGTMTIAYSFGTPVVTTNVGEYPELVRDTGCGLTVPPDDSQALADAILTILMNNELRETMEENTRTMRDKLSWDTIATKHMDLYSRIV